jgi:hypothetical protein
MYHNIAQPDAAANPMTLCRPGTMAETEPSEGEAVDQGNWPSLTKTT